MPERKCQVCTVYEAVVIEFIGNLSLALCDSCLEQRVRPALKSAVKRRLVEKPKSIRGSADA